MESFWGIYLSVHKDYNSVCIFCQFSLYLITIKYSWCKQIQGGKHSELLVNLKLHWQEQKYTEEMGIGE